MSELSDISSILQDSLLLSSSRSVTANEKLQAVKSQLNALPSVLDEETLTGLKNGEYEISLKEYTDMNTYNTMMNTLYGNNSANNFQSLLNTLSNNAGYDLASAKSFVNNMKAHGMSSEKAVKTYTALQKYSMLSYLGNYNFVNAKV